MAWNHSLPQDVQKRNAPRKSRGLVAGLLVAVALGAALYFMMAGRNGLKREATPKSDRTIKEAKPAAAPKGDNPKVVSTGVKKVDDVLAKLDEKPKTPIKMREISPEEWDRLTNRTFKTGAEQLMSWVFSVEPGDMPMPIPNMGEEDRQNIVAILLSKNEIKETDSEMTAFCKEQVDAAKKEMMKYLKEGGDPDDFLQYYFKELKLAYDKRNDAIEHLQQTYEEDPELAGKLCEAINKKFEEDGIKKITKGEFEDEDE